MTPDPRFLPIGSLKHEFPLLSGLFALSPSSNVPAQYIDSRFARNTLYIVVGSFKKDTTHKAFSADYFPTLPALPAFRRIVSVAYLIPLPL
jgi:hypothetical protein